PEAWQERGGQVVRRLRSGNPVSRVAAHGTARIPGRNQSPSETASPFLPRSSFWALLDHFAPANQSNSCRFTSPLLVEAAPVRLASGGRSGVLYASSLRPGGLCGCPGYSNSFMAERRDRVHAGRPVSRVHCCQRGHDRSEQRSAHDQPERESENRVLEPNVEP